MAQARLPIEIRSSGIKGHFAAYAGKRIVARAAAWTDSRGDFVIMEVLVLPAYRRRGIATRMYQTIEEQAGRQLKPAVSLSDDGFEFWKAYRPEAVAHDLRHQPELVGRRARVRDREGVITKASGSMATLVFDVGRCEGEHTYIHARDLDAALLPEHAADGCNEIPRCRP